MPIQVTVEGIREVSHRLRDMDPKTTIFLKHQVDRASSLLRETIIADLVAGTWGVKSRHGTAGLAGSVHELPATEAGGTITGGVGGAAPPFQYGAMQEAGGKGSYEIVGKPVLAWPAYGIFQKRTAQGKFAFTADTIFAKRVHHPALKKAPWMTGPLQDVKDQILAMLVPSGKDLF